MNQRQGNIWVVFLAVAAIAVSGIVGFWWKQKQATTPTQPLTWEECLKIPGAITTAMYPGTCNAPDGRSVTQPLSEEEKKNLVPPIADKTAGWKTYTNSVMGFSVKYPPDKNFRISGDQIKSVFVMVPSSDYGFVVTVEENPDYLSPTFWLKNNFDRLYNNVQIDGKPVTISDLKTVEVGAGGGPAIEVTVKNLPSSVLIGHPYKDRLYLIKGSTLEPDLFKLILDTFRL